MPHSEHSKNSPTDSIARTANGRAIRCRDCGALEVRFGNAIMRLDPEDLPSVIDAVAKSPRRSRRSAGDTDATSRGIELYIANTSVGFAFTAAEIVELKTLLRSAERALTAERLHVVDGDAALEIIPLAIQQRLQGIS